jgi:hypothetical protein
MLERNVGCCFLDIWSIFESDDSGKADHAFGKFFDASLSKL